ncbi:MAG: c-type cytochrome [Chromatiaceae bacterium]|jgi:cytochrome c553
MKDFNKALAFVAALAAGPAMAGADGKELFEYHGCINCHGAGAKEPISKMVPKLAGKPQEELFKKAKKILSGEGETEESKVMHAAFYSPAQCDVPPDDAELEAITTYISSVQ